MLRGTYTDRVLAAKFQRSFAQLGE